MKIKIFLIAYHVRTTIHSQTINNFVFQKLIIVKFIQTQVILFVVNVNLLGN